MPNIIGDIAGEFDTLMALLKKMPDDEPISVGDMIDRGPKSKEVIEFFMENGQAILGNHEHFLVDYVKERFFYQKGIWARNGGNKTLESFEWHIPHKVVDWISNLPLSIEFETKNGIIFVAHSFLPPNISLEKAMNIEDSDCYTGIWGAPLNIIWSREDPIRRPEYIMQIAGHNSQMGLSKFKDKDGVFAICIDSSGNDILTGIHIPSMEIFQQEYI